MMKYRLSFIACILLAWSVHPGALAKVYLTQDEFLAQRFSHATDKPKLKTVWLDKALQEKISGILGHPYPKLRLRYWQLANQTAWVLEEIGKEKPITFGVSIRDHRIDSIQVLEFRESRGYEIHMETFSRQFDELSLTEDQQLSGHIDGITGATMSVSAMKKIARVGLLLHKEVTEGK